MREINSKVERGSKMVSFLRILIAIFILLLPAGLNGDIAGVIQLRDDALKPIGIGSNIAIYEDPTATLSVEEVVKKNGFVAGLTNLKIGPSRSYFWIRLRVSNQSSHDIWYVNSKVPIIEVKAYRLIDGKYPFEHPPLEVGFPAYRLVIPSGTTATFLLRVRSLHMIDLDFSLMRPDYLLRHGMFDQTLITYSVAWFLIALILYNLFLYISIREKIYLFYLAFAIVNTHIGLMAVNHPNGVLDWFGVNWFAWSEFYRPLAPLTAFCFARELLKTKTQHPILDRLFTVYVSGLLVLMLISLSVPPSQIFEANDVYFNAGIVILLVAGFFSNIERETKIYYFIGWGSFLVGLLILIFSVANILPDNSLTRNAHLFGQMVEMLVMSLALAAKIKQLQREKTTAEVKYKTKSDFLAYWTHEIRAPVRILKSQIELMDRDPLIQRLYGAYVGRLLKALDHIESLIKDSIDHKQIETGTLEIELMEVRTVDVINHVRKMLEPLALQKNIGLDFEIINMPSTIRTDPFRLKQIMINMIENSIKFTGQGGVRVILTTTLSGKNSTMLWITVDDDGVGINSSRRSAIFRMLNRAGKPDLQCSEEMGVGLGLSIKLARLLGGDIWLCDQDELRGSGTRFLIVIDIGPYRGTDDAYNGPDKHQRDQVCERKDAELCITGMRILMAQERNDRRQICAHFLRYYGADVIEAANEDEMQRAALSPDLDLIFTDLQSSAIDGAKIGRHLRDCGVKVPIIAIAEPSSQESAARKSPFRFTDYLVQPVDRRTLLEKASEFNRKKNSCQARFPCYMRQAKGTEHTVLNLLN